MQLGKDYIYHVYNQGNNKQKIFFNRENYLFFLKKIKTHILPYTDILAWCFTPNHFHLMVLVNELELDADIWDATQSCAPNNQQPKKLISLNQSFGMIQSSYTKAINKQQKRTGSLFRKRIKTECVNCPNGITPSFYNTNTGTQLHIDNPEKQYPQICFNYIHQNPVKAGLVKNNIDWEFSSAIDYAELRDGKLINKNLAIEYVKI